MTTGVVNQYECFDVGYEDVRALTTQGHLLWSYEKNPFVIVILIEYKM